MQKDPYIILGVSYSATPEEIKRAYRKKAFELHPDRNSNDQAEELFRELNEAYALLTDTEKRRNFDKQYQSYSRSNADQFNHYFEMYVSSNNVKVCEEFELTFTYTGEGRFMQKPDLRDFYIAGKPFVSFQDIYRSGKNARETTIRYVLAAKRTGNFTINRAAIKLFGKTFFTTSQFIQVAPGKCFFSPDKFADGKPLQVSLWYNAEKGGTNRKYLVNTKHNIYIPRSHYAQVYNTIGRILKLFFALWGLILAIKIDRNVVIGFIIGSAYGAMMTYLLYYFVKVKPVFMADRKYSLVNSYVQNGYQPYPPHARNLISRAIMFVNKLFL